MNNVVIVGRLTDNPTKKKMDNGSVVTTVTLAVDRPFKNMEGDYDTDFIRCTLWDGIAEAACEYCFKGSLVGIKGRLVNKTQTIMVNSDNKRIYSLELIGERVEFIASPKDKMLSTNSNSDQMGI